MMNSKKKLCSICKKRFFSEDLYPNALIRDNLFKDVVSVFPDFTRDGFICYPDYRDQNGKYYEKLLEKEKGRLTSLEKEVIESLKKQEFVSENTNEAFDERQTLGTKISDKIAQFGGSWTFIISFFGVITLWMTINVMTHFTEPFDPFPFILLNLVLSCLAAVQAPIILMSQNRQAERDRIQSNQDYLVNLKAELQIRQLNSRFDVFMKHHLQIVNEILQSQQEIQEEIEKRNILQARSQK